jgi:rubredoxin
MEEIKKYFGVDLHKCPKCGKDELVFVISPLCPWKKFQCKACSMIFMAEEIGSIYKVKRMV